MYFASRVQAGRMLATRLENKYRFENCAVLALDDGGVIVGTEIATKLHCVITMLMSKEIKLPMEPVAVAGVGSGGVFSYNSRYSPSELYDITSENRGFIEEEKLRSIHEINRITSNVGTVDKKLLSGHNIIIVSDGLNSAFTVDLVYEFLKPIKIEKLIFAIPMASVGVVDKMHILGDELYCLDVLEDFPDKNHYYDNNDLPSHEEIIKEIERIVLKWK